METRQIDTSTTDLLASLDEGVLTLTMNRPEARNALTRPMIEALSNQLAVAEFDIADLAKRDGATFLFHHAPVEVLGKDGHVTGLRLALTRFNDSGALEQIEGSEFTQPFDMVLKAVGQQKQSDWLSKIFPELEMNRNGTMVRDFETGQTSLRGVFAGGDCANGGREVVNAVGEGKKAARGMHKMFGAANVVGPIQPSRWGVPDGPYGSGLDAPIRVPELEAKIVTSDK